MDSLTQFVLGAAVSTACLGRKIGPRKAALLGGLLGTLPDLDVFIPFDDPIDTFVYHRGWTHSIFVHALAAPLIGEALVRLIKGLRDCRWLVYITVYLCLATHAIIDAMTVYGTRIFWPLYADPVGVGSVFIIDPFYTLPLLAIVIWALFRKDWSGLLGRWTAAVLTITTGYMVLSYGIQRQVEAETRQVFEKAGIAPQQVYAIAAPFNILLWKVIGLEDQKYHNLYVSLLDGVDQPTIYSHERRPDLVACLQESAAFQKLDWFSDGFYKAEQINDNVIISDLRMGLTPGYAFRFIIGEVDGDTVREIPPLRDPRSLSVDAADFTWLWTRLLGKPSIRLAELRIEGAPDALLTVADNSTCSVPVKAG
ncbi:MAG: metal-dependent hydrolase [Roseibium sp.]